MPKRPKSPAYRLLVDDIQEVKAAIKDEQPTLRGQPLYAVLDKLWEAAFAAHYTDLTDTIELLMLLVPCPEEQQ